MAHIHSSCLADWRAHSATPHQCEICRTPYRLPGGFLRSLSNVAGVVWNVTTPLLIVGLCIAAAHQAEVQWQEEAERRRRTYEWARREAARLRQRQEARLQRQEGMVSVGKVVGLAIAALRDVIFRRP